MINFVFYYLFRKCRLLGICFSLFIYSLYEEALFFSTILSLSRELQMPHALCEHREGQRCPEKLRNWSKQHWYASSNYTGKLLSSEINLMEPEYYHWHTLGIAATVNS